MSDPNYFIALPVHLWFWIALSHLSNNLVVLNDYVAILPCGPFRKTFLECFELSASGQGNTRYCNISLCDEMFTLMKYFVIVII